MHPCPVDEHERVAGVEKNRLRMGVEHQKKTGSR